VTENLKNFAKFFGTKQGLGEVAGKFSLLVLHAAFASTRSGMLMQPALAVVAVVSHDCNDKF
jgi:hypothetical protein